MLRIYLSLLVILFFNGQVQSAEDTDEYIPLSFANIRTVFNWALKLYESVNAISTHSTLTEQNSQLLYQETKKLVTELAHLGTAHVELPELISLFALRLREIGIEVHIPDNTESNPSTYMNKINEYYNYLMNNERPAGDVAERRRYFSTVLSYDSMIQTTLKALYDLVHDATRPNVVSGSSVTLGQMSSLKLRSHVCTSLYSGQQDLYYFYVQLLLTEMKGLAGLQHIYAEVRLDGLDKSMASTEVTEIFVNRMKIYHKRFSQLISLLSQEKFNCEIEQLQRDVNILEVKKFSRARILDLFRRSTTPCDVASSTNCESYIERNLEVSRSGTKTLYACTDFRAKIKACPDGGVSSRAYSWFEDTQSHVHYGPNTPCARAEVSYKHNAAHDHCPICVCSVDTNVHQENTRHEVSGISVTEEISDIWNNMVVTGIKFVIHKNAIHLQIQQTKFSDDALNYNGAAWKTLGVEYSSTGGRQGTITYQPLQYDHKSIYLDDIKMPNGYAVTGVRFKLVDNSAFMLQVHGTPFDIETAELDKPSGKWFDASTRPMKPKDYKRPRTEIKIDGVDSPFIATTGFDYDRESNKFIKFTHTDLKKDAGQTTVPLLDARPAESQLLFPLSGIGLSYRGKDGYGGYITPTIYTMDLAPYLTMSVVHKECPSG